MKISKENIKKIAEEGIEKLNSIEKLPNEGILGGASLGNYIYSKICDLNFEPKVNDIDVFYFEKYNKEKEKEEYNSYKLLNSKVETKKTKDENYFFIRVKSIGNSWIRIFNSKKYGKLNKIYYCGEIKNKLKDLINTFDINSTQIGYDLKEKRLYYTDDFIDFLKTKQLKITSLDSPFNTIIRIVKKAKELKCNLNLKEEVELINFLFSNSSKIKNFKNIKRNFGPKYINLYYKYERDLKKYFFIHKEAFYTQNKLSEYYIDPDKKKKFKNILTKKEKFFNCFIDYIIYPKSSKYELWKKIVLNKENDLYSLSLNNNYLFNKRLTSINKIDQKTLIYLFRKYKKSESYKYLINKGGCFEKFLIINKKYIDENEEFCNSFISKVETVKNALTYFNRLEQTFFKYNLNEQYKIIVDIIYKKLKEDINFFFLFRLSENLDFNKKITQEDILINSIKYRKKISKYKDLKKGIEYKNIEYLNYEDIVYKFLNMVDHYKNSTKQITIPRRLNFLQRNDFDFILHF